MQLGACLFLMKSSGCARLFSHGQAWMEKWIVVQMRRRGEKKVNWFCWPSVYEGWSRLRWHTSGWMVGNKIRIDWQWAVWLSVLLMEKVDIQDYSFFFLLPGCILYCSSLYMSTKYISSLLSFHFSLCPKFLTRWMSHSYPTERGEEEAEWCIQHRWADSPRGLFYL